MAEGLSTAAQAAALTNADEYARPTVYGIPTGPEMVRAAMSRAPTTSSQFAARLRTEAKREGHGS